MSVNGRLNGLRGKEEEEEGRLNVTKNGTQRVEIQFIGTEPRRQLVGRPAPLRPTVARINSRPFNALPTAAPTSPSFTYLSAIALG